jgi:hypothetical protein
MWFKIMWLAYVGIYLVVSFALCIFIGKCIHHGTHDPSDRRGGDTIPHDSRRKGEDNWIDPAVSDFAAAA